MKFIIKLFPEITIKSKFVRKQNIALIKKNITFSLKKVTSDFKVFIFWDKLEVVLEDESMREEIVSRLKKVSGIENFLEVQHFDIKASENSEIFDFIFHKIKDFYLSKIENKSFVVRIKRSGNHSFKSIDLERYVGGGLLKYSNNTTVDLHSAQVLVSAEIKDNKLFVVKEVFKGFSGYPVGAQDKILSLISGGFDSGVSSYLAMKRGCKVDYLFFNLGGSAHELGVKQVASYLRDNYSAGYRARFICVNFEEIVRELLTKVNHKYRGVLLKRYMLKAADMIAQAGRYYGLVKGDSLGQVSSQTLKNLNVISKASDTFIMRPLLTYNKQEIIDISMKIGTYNFAINMPEYCGVISDRPSTGARLEDVLEEEKNIDLNILISSIENKKVENIEGLLEQELTVSEEIEIVSKIEDNEIIIDIRDAEKKKKNPKALNGLENIELPFFDINNRFKDLDQSKKYLFYCDKGVLSKLHALYLKEKGFSNIKVFRLKNNNK